MDTAPDDVKPAKEGFDAEEVKPQVLSTPAPDGQRTEPLTTPIADPLPVSEGFEAYDGPSITILNAEAADKQFSRGKQALVDMAKADKRTGISEADMQAYKDLNKELPDPFPAKMVRGAEAHPDRGPHAQQWHGHVGPVDHIPVRK